MWLIITFICAVCATLLHFGIKRHGNLRLHFLALMLWGTFIMVLVDHSIAFAENGGDFIEITTSGLVPDAALLGGLMVVPLVAVWAAGFARKK